MLQPPLDTSTAVWRLTHKAFSAITGPPRASFSRLPWYARIFPQTNGPEAPSSVGLGKSFVLTHHASGVTLLGARPTVSRGGGSGWRFSTSVLVRLWVPGKF